MNWMNWEAILGSCCLYGSSASLFVVLKLCQCLITKCAVIRLYHLLYVCRYGDAYFALLTVKTLLFCWQECILGKLFAPTFLQIGKHTHMSEITEEINFPDFDKLSNPLLFNDQGAFISHERHPVLSLHTVYCFLQSSVQS